jgi:hypothetical protein
MGPGASVLRRHVATSTNPDADANGYAGPAGERGHDADAHADAYSGARSQRHPGGDPVAVLSRMPDRYDADVGL